MISDDVLIEHVYLDINNKKKYKVVAIGWGLFNTKNDNNNLRRAVVYTPADGSDTVFTRTIESFKANFEEIDNTIDL